MASLNSPKSIAVRLATILSVVLLALAGFSFPGGETLAQSPPSYSAEVVAELQNGKKLLNMGNYAEAIRVFSDLINSEPKCVDAYICLALSNMHEGNLKNAESSLRTALRLDPLNHAALFNLGLVMMAQRKDDEAIVFFKQAMQLGHEDDYELHVNLANALVANKEYAEAVSHFEKALKLKPDYAPAYNGLAQLYYAQGRFDMAAEEAQKAIKFRPDYALAHYYLGLIEQKRGRTNQARASLENSLKYEKNPQYQADTRARLARLSRQGQQTEDNPEERKAQMKRVYELLRKRQWREAEDEIRVYMGQFGDSDAAMWNNLGYAIVHQDSGTNATEVYKKAIEHYQRAIDRKKGVFATAHYNMGQALRLLGDTQGAEKAFRKSIDDARLEHKTIPVALNALGLLLKQKGKYREADAAYRLAIAQSGVELPVVHFNRAICLEKLDRSREAIPEYKAYLKLSPGGLNAKQARVRLKRLGVDLNS